jgi:hypothetical protein
MKLQLPCKCCGRGVPDANPRQPLHLDCWTEHHSDPTGVWPPDHKCGLTAEEEEDEEEYEPVVKWRKPPPYVCLACKDGDCIVCTDVLRLKFRLPKICFCKRKNHGLEDQDAVPTVQADDRQG